MQLIDHLSITVNNLENCVLFYKAIMQTLNAKIAYEEAEAIGFGERNSATDASHSYISIFESTHCEPNIKRHVCFKAASIEQVNSFYKAGLENGGSCAGAPGYREYHAGYYAAFLFDPEGNKVEAVYHGT